MFVEISDSSAKPLVDKLRDALERYDRASSGKPAEVALISPVDDRLLTAADRESFPLPIRTRSYLPRHTVCVGRTEREDEE